MGVMRSVVLSLAALLVIAAVAFAQDPGPSAPGGAAPQPTTTPNIPPPDDTPVPAAETPADPEHPPDFATIAWRHSTALGGPARNGRLRDGVQLPELGEDFFTWDPVRDEIPNRGSRRWGTDRLLRTVLTVIHAYRMDRDSAQRVGIMDLSREHGGPFGRNFGGLGHASHQNGLDADILYPRKDGTEARATRPAQVDRKLAQDLVDRFVAAGAVKVFVGPHLNLKGPRNVVVPLIYHDDHLHVRIR
jgi:murein endopeptidase